jgi:hypothetical protein
MGNQRTVFDYTVCLDGGVARICVSYRSENQILL